MKTPRCVPSHKSCSAAHWQLCQGYWMARQADLERLEQVTALYPAEVEEYERTHRLITFKEYLIGQRHDRRAVAA